MWVGLCLLKCNVTCSHQHDMKHYLLILLANSAYHITLNKPHKILFFLLCGNSLKSLFHGVSVNSNHYTIFLNNPAIHKLHFSAPPKSCFPLLVLHGCIALAGITSFLRVLVFYTRSNPFAMDCFNNYRIWYANFSKFVRAQLPHFLVGFTLHYAT